MAVDYNILLNKRVDTSSNISIDEQILQIAIYDEYKAYEIYTKIIEKFGNINPFVNIKEAEAVHYSVLINLAQKYSVEVPENDWRDKITISNTIIECCELGVAAEIENINMYNELLKYSTKSDITDVLFKLQAASFNNHLPIFRSSVLAHYSMGNNPKNSENIILKIEEYQAIIDDILNGNIDESFISKLLPSLNAQFLTGAGSGAVLSYLLNEFIKNQAKE